METYSRTQSSSGSQPQRIRDYAPSSIVSSVSSSWDTVEHDYDAKATAQVQEMLEHLETFLYHGTLEQVIRGHNLLPTSDVGYEAIPRSELRSHSPYFFIPANPSDDKLMHSSPNPVAPEQIPSVAGIGLGNDIIGRKPESVNSPVDARSSRERSDLVHDGWPVAQSMFDWSDAKTQEAMAAITDTSATTQSPRWYLFRYRKQPNDDEAGDVAADEDRCPTPTPGNPFPRAPPLVHKPDHIIEVIANGNGELAAMKKQMGAVAKDGEEFRHFALLKQFRKRPAAVPAEGKEGAAQAQAQAVVSFIAWEHQKDAKEAPAHDGLEEVPVPPHIINVYDIMPLLEGLDCVLQEYACPSMEALLVTSVEALMSAMVVVDDGRRSWLNDSMEEVFAFDGEVEEWFACDNETVDETEDHKTVKSRSRQRRALPPVTPNASIKQDIVGHLFDDIWSEMVPVFHPLLESLSDDSATDEDDEVGGLLGEHGKLAFDEILLRQFGEGGDGLLSAMTIRPVSLQKRESSARIRSTFENGAPATNMPSMFEMYPSSRPTSARPTSARPTSARPTSGRNHDPIPHGAHQGAPQSRMQTAASNKGASYNNWKRSNPGMRLLPLPAVPGPGSMLTLPNGLTDMIYGTSIGIGSMKAAASHAWESSRPSTSIPASNSTSKRLPPIRGIVAQQEQQDGPGKGSDVQPSGRTARFLRRARSSRTADPTAASGLASAVLRKVGVKFRYVR
ncbi:hypothetical protein HDU88_007676 [Geranomyces variabilis]|nr:hypothetical protein HDU88_007676 [Geranomyces variabilis]